MTCVFMNNTKNLRSCYLKVGLRLPPASVGPLAPLSTLWIMGDFRPCVGSKLLLARTRDIFKGLETSLIVTNDGTSTIRIIRNHLSPALKIQRS